MSRLMSFILFYILVCIIGSTIDIIPNITLSALGAFVGSIFLGPVVGAFIAVFAMLLIGYWQGFPLAIAGHWIVAISIATSAYYFGSMYEKFVGQGWKRYVYSFAIGFTCYVGMGLFLLWNLIGNMVEVLVVPWIVSASLSMLIAFAIDYGWPDSLRHYLGGPLPKVVTGKNRARKRRKELFTRNRAQIKKE